MRQHNSLAELLTKETQSIAPRSAARRILKEIPKTATAIVLFGGPNSWIALPVGPELELKSTVQASRTKVSGKSPVAYCPRL